MNRSKKAEKTSQSQNLTNAVAGDGLNCESDDSTAAVLKKIAGNQPVTEEEKLAVLRLAAAESLVLDQAVFEKLFSEIIESKYMTWTGWTSVITGRQAREYIMNVLSDRTSSEAKVISVARYCFWARRDGIPALALVAVLERLGPAVSFAKGSPGETWEDRNWGGYTTSGSEDLADALSLAVTGFVERDCKAVGWPELVAALARLTSINLSRIRLGESSVCGFSCSTMNLLARLETKFKRMKNTELTNAVAALRKKTI